ncbi:MAG: hypothetical protein ACYDAC_11270 [Candidatus Dormibacteria bacterium]
MFEAPQSTYALTDEDVSVDVTIQQAGSADSRGLICRAASGGSNAAFYALYYSDRYFLITYDAPDNTRVLVKTPNNRFTAATGNVHIEALCTGTNPVKLALYVNGEPVASASDSTSALTSGSAGIFVRNDSGQTEVVDFRNLEIRGTS